MTDKIAPSPPRRWTVWAAGALAVGLGAAATAQLSRASDETLAMIGQLSPAVWAAWVALYLVQPVADAVIFRRLWGLKLADFGVVLRKVAINEVLFGYTGELFFYLWARRRARLAAAAFGAIKDVNIVSALGGNVLTLATLGLSAHALKSIDLGRQLGPLLWPSLAVVGLSFAVPLFARRLFSLTRRELLYVSVVHAARMAVSSALTLLVWRSALPGVEPGVWLALLAGRLLLARLPLVANKDLVFANLLLALFGAGSPTAILLATLAIATLLTHLAVIVATNVPGLLRAMLRRA
ncbi:hypothetical protein [Phenylobacterium immobile]|uniref:hypothetical protein n=1 Tax=Phenylobacterium immobile TaxID=21 RepID=UPI000A480505|nr:hypothetical protein [Phenylobacterium immobile]